MAAAAIRLSSSGSPDERRPAVYSSLLLFLGCLLQSPVDSTGTPGVALRAERHNNLNLVLIFLPPSPH